MVSNLLTLSWFLYVVAKFSTGPEPAGTVTVQQTVPKEPQAVPEELLSFLESTSKETRFDYSYGYVSMRCGERELTDDEVLMMIRLSENAGHSYDDRVQLFLLKIKYGQLKSILQLNRLSSDLSRILNELMDEYFPVEEINSRKKKDQELAKKTIHEDQEEKNRKRMIELEKQWTLREMQEKARLAEEEARRFWKDLNQA